MEDRSSIHPVSHDPFKILQNNSEAVPDSASPVLQAASSSSAAVEFKSAATSEEEDDDDFHDAVDEVKEFEVSAPSFFDKADSRGASGKSDSGGSKDDDFTDDEGEETDTGGGGGGSRSNKNRIHVFQKKGSSSSKSSSSDLTAIMNDPASSMQVKPLRQRRTRIQDRPNLSISLWSILKNSIGKDLSKMPVPVNFSEPLSFLQRLTEDLTYAADILHRAALCKDNYEQMAYVAGFAVSAYGSTAIRASKPFNPLLGETFECDRGDDLGWRCISEQVRRHEDLAASCNAVVLK